MANFSNTVQTSTPPLPYPLKGYSAPNSNQSTGLLNSYLQPAQKPVQPQPSTPVKSQKTGADGSTETTYHAPQNNQQSQPTPTPTTASAPQTPVPPATPQQNTSQNGAQIAPNNPLLAAAYDQATYAPNLRQNLSNSELALTRKGIALPFITGQQSAMEQTYGNEVLGQGQKASALGSLANLGQPQAYSLYSQPYNPLTDTYGGGGANGAIDRSVQASNIGNAGDFNSQIEQKKSVIGAVQANSQLLGSYLDGFTKAGVAPDTGIIQGINQLLAKNLISNADVSAFNTQLASLRSQWSALNNGADATKAIPDTITPEGLKGVIDSIVNKTNNDITNLQQSLGGLKTDAGKTNQTSSSSTAPGVSGIQYNNDGTLKAVKF